MLSVPDGARRSWSVSENTLEEDLRAEPGAGVKPALDGCKQRADAATIAAAQADAERSLAILSYSRFHRL